MKFIGAAIQMDGILGDYQHNMDKAEQLVRQAAAQGAKLVVLPEFFSTGLRLDERYHEFAERIPEGKTTQTLISWAKELELYLVGCMGEEGETSGVVYDTAFVVGPEGYLGKQRKISPWWQEKLYLKGGHDLQPIPTPLGNLGLLICYDAGFPEIARKLAINGANLFIIPSGYGKARLYAWDTFTKARALENGCFVIASNRHGQEKDSIYAGHSRIIDPRGLIVAELPQAEEDGIVLAEIDLEQTVEQRRTIPYLQDLRQDLFHY